MPVKRTASPEKIAMGNQTIVVGGYKYWFLTANKRQQLQTWRCSAKFCRGRIYVTDSGDVVGASEDHNHGELDNCELADGPSNQIPVHKEVEGSDDDAMDDAMTDTLSIRTIHNVRTNQVHNEVTKGDSLAGGIVSADVMGQLQDDGLALPKLGEAFSMVDRPNVFSFNFPMKREDASIPAKIKEETEGLHSSLDNTSTSQKDLGIPRQHLREGDYFGDFTVTKDTRVMRGMLAEALERLAKNNPERSTPAAGPSPPHDSWSSTQKRLNTNDHHISSQKGESDSDESFVEGGFWRCVKLQQANKWEEDIEINVVDVDEDGDGLPADDGEMAAMLGGPWM